MPSICTAAMAALATAPVAAGNRTCAGASTSYAQAPQRRCSGASRPSSAQQQQRRALIASSGVRSSRRAATARRAAAAAASASFGGGEIVEVKDLKGIRVLKNEDDSPRVEYLVEWKDGSPDTWCALEGGRWMLLHAACRARPRCQQARPVPAPDCKAYVCCAPASPCHLPHPCPPTQGACGQPGGQPAARLRAALVGRHQKGRRGDGQPHDGGGRRRAGAHRCEQRGRAGGCRRGQGSATCGPTPAALLLPCCPPGVPTPAAALCPGTRATPSPNHTSLPCLPCPALPARQQWTRTGAARFTLRRRWARRTW